MSVSRRDCLKVAGATAGAVGLTGCARVMPFVRRQAAPTTFDVPAIRSDRDVRLLNRAGFGPTSRDLADLSSMGHEAWIDKQLADTVEEDRFLVTTINSLDITAVEGMEMRDFPLDAILGQMQQAAILRARYGRNQVKERLVDFWTNHFNIYGRKGLSAYRKPHDEAEVVRKHALGYFPEMLMASAKSPAMLGYLDNRLSDKDHPNENYAREIMELHSLGINGGYSQQDIHEVARCFTGWAVEQRFMHRRGEFQYVKEWHDMGVKTVLGQKIRPKSYAYRAGEHSPLSNLIHGLPMTNDDDLVGLNEGEEVVLILANHPSTAHFISKKLCRYFLNDRGDEWVDRTAKIYLETGGHIPSMIKPLLMADDLHESHPKIKRPFDLLVSSLRVTETDTDGGPPIFNQLKEMGEPLYQWPMPDGYPDKTESWSSGLLPRWNFALMLGRNEFKGTSIDHGQLGGTPFDPHRVASLILRRPVDHGSVESKALSGLDPAMAVAVCLSAPEFQWR